MKNFDPLNLGQNIEEKRLILGQKIENFLLKKLGIFLSFLGKSVTRQNFVLIGSTAIIAISIFVRSSKDLGNDSALFLLSFLSNLDPLLALASLDLALNLLGIITLFFCYKILRNSKFGQDKTALNLLILSFVLGFFLPVFTIQFNELFTKAALFLALAFIYVSLQISQKEDRLHNSLIGSVSGLLYLLKPNYVFLPLVFEIFFPQRKIISRLLVAIPTIIFGLLFYKNFTPDLLESHLTQVNHIISFSQSQQAFYKFKYHFFLIFLSFALLMLWQKNKTDKKLLALSATSALISLSEIEDKFTHVFYFYSLSLPFLFLALRNSKDNFNYQKDWLWVVLVIFLLQFDHKFFAIIADLPIFWFGFVLFLAQREKHSGSGFLLLNNQLAWLKFSALSALTIFGFAKYPNFTWLFCAFIFAYLALFYQKLNGEKFSRFSTILISAAIAYFLNLNLGSIFNSSQLLSYHLQSPNYLSEEIARHITHNSKPGEKITIIANKESTPIATILYLGNTSYTDLDLALSDKNNRLIFVERINDQCSAGYLEIYLRDSTQAKNFFANYQFLNRITETIEAKNEIKFFHHVDEILPFSTKQFIVNDFEVYVRK